MADAARILEEALSLADQRARIAHELIESLDGDGGAERVRKVEGRRSLVRRRRLTPRRYFEGASVGVALRKRPLEIVRGVFAVSVGAEPF
jgi:hypothetical protein